MSNSKVTMKKICWSVFQAAIAVSCFMVAVTSFVYLMNTYEVWYLIAAMLGTLGCVLVLWKAELDWWFDQVKAITPAKIVVPNDMDDWFRPSVEVPSRDQQTVMAIAEIDGWDLIVEVDYHQNSESFTFGDRTVSVLRWLPLKKED
jgi:hypothetical protein